MSRPVAKCIRNTQSIHFGSRRPCAKTKREKRIVRDRIAGQLPPPRRKEIAMARTYCEISVVTHVVVL
jgi:hypothetical protein